MKLIKLLFLLFVPTFLSAQTLTEIDEIAPFSEGLAAVRKGSQWGFINEEGNLVIDFRDDIHWNLKPSTSKNDVRGIGYPKFQDGRCMIKKTVEQGVTVYGFIDPEGNVVIEPQFLNVYPFEDGYTTAVLFRKILKGKNEFQLKIYEFKFNDVLVHRSGEIKTFFEPRHGIQMTSKRYRLPTVGARKLNKGLIAVQVPDKGWELRKLVL